MTSSWSDGEAVDADDFKFTYDAIASELVETPRKSNVELIDSIEVLDPQTVQITFKEVKCDALERSGAWLAAEPPLCRRFQRHHGQRHERGAGRQRRPADLPELGA